MFGKFFEKYPWRIMKNICALAFVFLTYSSPGIAVTYDVVDQTGFVTAMTASAASSENNTINVNASGGVAISSPAAVSGNSPNLLTINVNGVNGFQEIPFNVDAPVNVNAQGEISLLPTSSSTVQMNITSSLTQTGGTVSATNGSAIVIQEGGSYSLNGGVLEVGGVNGLSAVGSGVFNLGATTTEVIRVIDSDLTLNMNMHMDTPLPPTGSGVAVLDTNGLNATISGSLTTPNNTSGVPVFAKGGEGNLTLQNFTMTGGGEFLVLNGTVGAAGNVSIPYFSLGTGAGADATLNLSDSTLNFTISQPDAGNQAAGFQVGDFGGTATVNHSAGTLNIHDASFNISNQGGQGTYNLSGGALNFTSLDSSVSFFNIGRNTGANPATTGILNVSGTGLLNVHKTNGNVNMIIGSRATSLGAHSSGEVNQTGGTIRLSNGANLYLAGFGDGVYNLTGGTLEIGGTSLNGVFTGGSGAYLFNLGGTGTIKVIETDLNSDVNMTLVSGGNAAIDANGFNANLSGLISGPGALTKKGAGRLILTGANTYSGGTTVAAGVLEGNSTSLQGSIVNNASVVFNQALDGTYAGNMSGIGALTKEGLGRLILAGSNTYFGGTTVAAGILQGNSTSLQGSIINNASVVFDQAADGTYAGNMSGTGALTKEGAGKLILTGSNTYFGGTQITSGALQGDSESLQGNIAVNSASIVFDQASPGIFNGTLTGNSAAALNKIGASTLTFNTDNGGFVGTTNVLQGELALNSNLGGNIHVSQTGVLSGVGTALGDVNVDEGGTIAPGNKVGAFNILGNYTQGPDGTYLVTLNNGQNSLINTDLASNLDGTLSISIIDGVNFGTSYDILHANGGIFGTFSKVIASPVLIPKITYTETDVFLRFATNFAAIAVTKNQRAVANQLDAIKVPNTTQTAVFNQLVLLAQDPSTIRAARKAFSEMSGQQYTNSLIISELSNNQFTNHIYDALRSTVTSPCSETLCNNCGLCPWLEFDGGQAFFDGNKEASGFKANNFSTAGGIQKRLSSRWTVGVAGSYDNNKIHYHLKGHSRNRIGSGAFYALYRPEHYYIWGDIAFGCNQQRVKRSIDIGEIHFKARSKPKNYLGSAYLEAGYDFFLNRILFQPFLGVQAGYFKSGHVHESKAGFLNLNISSKSHGNAASNLGFHATSADFACGVNLSADLFWQYRFGKLHNSVSAHFSSFGDRFTIVGAPLSRNSIHGALTLSKYFANNWNCYAEAAGQKWAQASSYSFTGGIQYCW